MKREMRRVKLIIAKIAVFVSGVLISIPILIALLMTIPLWLPMRIFFWALDIIEKEEQQPPPGGG